MKWLNSPLSPGHRAVQKKHFFPATVSPQLHPGDSGSISDCEMTLSCLPSITVYDEQTCNPRSASSGLSLMKGRGRDAWVARRAFHHIYFPRT